MKNKQKWKGFMVEWQYCQPEKRTGSHHHIIRREWKRAAEVAQETGRQEMEAQRSTGIRL